MDIIDFKKRRLIGDLRMGNVMFIGGRPGAKEFSEIVHVELEYKQSVRGSDGSGEKLQAPLIVRADYTGGAPQLVFLSLPEEVAHGSNNSALIPAIRGIYERFPTSAIHQLGKRRVYVIKGNLDYPAEREIDVCNLGDVDLKSIGLSGKMGLTLVANSVHGCNAACIIYDKNSKAEPNATICQLFPKQKLIRGDAILIIMDKDHNIVNTRGNPIDIFRIMDFDEDSKTFAVKDQFRYPVKPTMAVPAELVEKEFGLYIIEKN